MTNSAFGDLLPDDLLNLLWWLPEIPKEIGEHTKIEFAVVPLEELQIKEVSMVPYAITNRIVKALHSDDTSEKARLLESVVAMNYKEWRVFHELGKVYSELGNQEKSRKYFLQALECKAGEKYKRETAAELEKLKFYPICAQLKSWK